MSDGDAPLALGEEAKQALLTVASRAVGAGAPWPDGAGVIGWGQMDPVLADLHARSVIVGGRGSGRTTSLRLLAWRALRAGAVPIVVSLRSWARERRESTGSFTAFLGRWLAHRGVVEALDLEARAPEISLYLDGLEHLDADARADLCRSITPLAGGPRLRWATVVVTSSEGDIPREWNPRWSDWRVQSPLFGHQAEAMLAAVRPDLPLSDPGRRELLRDLVEVPEAAAMASTPLWLAGALQVWLTTGRLPADLGALVTAVAADPRFERHEAVVAWRDAEHMALGPGKRHAAELLALDLPEQLRVSRSWRAKGHDAVVARFVAGLVERTAALDTEPALRRLAALLAEPDVWSAADRLELLRAFLRVLVSRSHDPRELAVVAELAERVLLGPGAVADDLRVAAQEVLVDGTVSPEALRISDGSELYGVLVEVRRRSGLD